MTTFGVSMVKDEADVVVGVMRHMADEVDHLLVADNGSTDGTRDLLDVLSRELPMTVVDDPEPAYYQSQKMTQLAHQAYDEGAVWIVPFDADELWYSPHGRVKELLATSKRNVVTADLYNHFATSLDLEDPDPFRAMIWRQRRPMTLPKVAVKWVPTAVIHQGNHGVTHPNADRPGIGLMIRHFPYRSMDQFVRKAVNGAEAYKLTDLPHELGAHWRGYGAIYQHHGRQALEQVYRDHFWYLSPMDSKMVRDPAPYLHWRGLGVR
jgi:hypothetical protein